MALYQRFFEAAQVDLNSAKVMTDRGLYQPAIYHLQQAYEKCIKSYFIFKEVNINNTPEATVYGNIRSLGHDTEESTITLIKDITDVEKRGYENRLPNTTDAHLGQRLQLAIDAIDSFKSSLDRLVQRLDLERRYINNVRNYSQFVKSKYEYYQNSINTAISKQPDMNFLSTVSCMITLYPCLYRMESITRYPLIEFAYDNLNLLSNVEQSCKSLIEILQDLITLISSDLK
jgi:HEPN domain-containing protein